MALRRLTDDPCEDGKTCPGVWQDDRYPDELIFVGRDVGSLVPLGPGEAAVRLGRRLFVEAGLGRDHES